MPRRFLFGVWIVENGEWRMGERGQSKRALPMMLSFVPLIYGWRMANGEMLSKCLIAPLVRMVTG